MDHLLLPASGFNRITPFERQTLSVPLPTLQELAELFIEQGMHVHWGVGLLHRHATIAESCVMVHESQKKEEDICKVMNIDDLEGTTLFPSALHLNANRKLQAYEYDTNGERSRLSLDFVHRFRDFLLSRSLQDTLAIIANPGPGQEHMLETLIADDRGVISGMMSVPCDRQSADTITTNWMFRQHRGQIEIIDVKACRALPTGLHEVTKDRRGEK